MTSITLPFKEFPGQTRRVPTFFGGRLLVAPMILLLAIPFTLYLYYHLSHVSLPSYELLGLLPYLWGSTSIAYCIKKSSDSVEALFEANLNEAQEIFDKIKSTFRTVIISTIVFSIGLNIVFTYSLIVYGSLSLFIIGLNSITSIGIALASFISRSKRTFIYICLVCASEAAFLLITFKGLWMFALIILVSSLLSLFLCLRHIDRYYLRSFFERVIN